MIEMQREIDRLAAQVRELRRFAGRFPVRTPVGGSGSGGSGTREFYVAEEFANYLRCVPWSGTAVLTGDTYVAKPKLLWHVASMYDGISTLTTVDVRTVDVTGSSGAGERWRIGWKYQQGVGGASPNFRRGIISARSAVTGLTDPGGDPIVWIDVNEDARAWEQV